MRVSVHQRGDTSSNVYLATKFTGISHCFSQPNLPHQVVVVVIIITSSSPPAQLIFCILSECEVLTPCKGGGGGMHAFGWQVSKVRENDHLPQRQSENRQVHLLFCNLRGERVKQYLKGWKVGKWMLACNHKSLLNKLVSGRKWLGIKTWLNFETTNFAFFELILARLGNTPSNSHSDFSAWLPLLLFER